MEDEMAKQFIEENNLECEIHFDTETGQLKTIGTRAAIMSGIMLILEDLLDDGHLDIEHIEYMFEKIKERR